MLDMTYESKGSQKPYELKDWKSQAALPSGADGLDLFLIFEYPVIEPRWQWNIIFRHGYEFPFEFRKNGSLRFAIFILITLPDNPPISFIRLYTLMKSKESIGGLLDDTPVTINLKLLDLYHKKKLISLGNILVASLRNLSWYHKKERICKLSNCFGFLKLMAFVDWIQWSGISSKQNWRLKPNTLRVQTSTIPWRIHGTGICTY